MKTITQLLERSFIKRTIIWREPVCINWGQ